MNISIRLILVILFLFIFSCATTPQEKKTPIVDAGYFAVEPPYGTWPPYDVWSCQVDKELGFIRFEKAKYSCVPGFRRFVGWTLIQVFRNGVKQEGWHLSEEEVADNFRSEEENIMRLEGGAKGEYKVKGVKKNVTTIGGKKLYFMSYKTGTPFKIFGGGKIIKAVLYLYFLPDFKENHIFYGFLFLESHVTGSLVTFDVELIYPVINSLKIKNP